MNPLLLAKIEAARKRVADMQALRIPGNVVTIPPQNEMIVTVPIPTDSIGLTRQEYWTRKLNFNPFILDSLTLNEDQCNAVEWFGLEGKSGCLIGPAGTGKTTTMKAIVRAAIAVGRISPMSTSFSHKHFHGSLGLWGGSYTKIATRNLQDNMPEELQDNICNLNQLLEFQPVFFDVVDPNTGKLRKTMRFEPSRNRFKPLPEELTMFMFDEGSTIGLELNAQVMDALPHKRDCQFIWIGDIAQLPPVFGDAILGYKLLSELVVELKEVYRHAGRIVNLANHIRIGKTIPGLPHVLKYLSSPTKLPLKEAEIFFNEWNGIEDGSTVTIHAWKKRLQNGVGGLSGDDAELKALQNLSGFFKKERKEGRYNPDTDMILMPYEKMTGSKDNILVSTSQLNCFISNELDVELGRVVWEVKAGREKRYFAVGDKVFFQREEAEIVKIMRNPAYAGSRVQEEGSYLNRWGGAKDGGTMASSGTAPPDFDDLMHILDVSTGIDEDSKHAASHVLTIRKFGETMEYFISRAADINELLMGYAITIHKSQGSQWKKVYCIFHNSHNRNLQRELLYTAITRAQKELYIIAEPETFIIGVQSQKIKGNTLKEKAEYFKGKQKQLDANNAAQQALTEESEE